MTRPLQGLVTQPVIGQLTGEGAHGIANMAARILVSENNCTEGLDWFHGVFAYKNFYMMNIYVVVDKRS